MKFQGNVRTAIITAITILLVSWTGFAWAKNQLELALRKKPVPLERPLATLPHRIDGWKRFGEDQYLPAEVIETLGTNKYLNRNYIDDSSDRTRLMELHLAYYTGLIDAVPHVPDRCMAAAGWVPLDLPENFELPLDQSRWLADRKLTFRDETFGQAETVHMPEGDFQIRTMVMEHDDHAGYLIAGYFFIANGKTTPTPDGVRLMAFNLQDEYAYYFKIQLSTHVTELNEDTIQQFVNDTAEFLDLMLPEMMLCLPDWVELQARIEAEKNEKRANSEKTTNAK